MWSLRYDLVWPSEYSQNDTLNEAIYFIRFQSSFFSSALSGPQCQLKRQHSYDEVSVEFSHIDDNHSTSISTIFWACIQRMLHSTRDTCSNLFIAALFIIEWNWKLPICPSAKREKEIVVLLNNGISLIYGEKGNDETHNQMMKLTTKWIELKQNKQSCWMW